ncbi:MAG: amidohydrolase family protein [Enterocloster bolteae]
MMITICRRRRWLEMTTIDAARCVGLDEEIGSLETGKERIL